SAHVQSLRSSAERRGPRRARPSFPTRRSSDLIHINQIHRAGGVLSHGLAIVVQHLLGVTVVGGDQTLTAYFQQRVGNAADAFVDALSGFYGSFVHTGVADHVAVGVVAHDQVELAVFNGGDQFVGDFRRAHFRLQIVGGDVG